MRHSTAIVVLVLICVLYGTSQAGELKCLVTRGGAPEASVRVTLHPGAMRLATDASGTCVFTGLAAGTYRVEAVKVVAGRRYGAVQQAVAVPATGGARVRLKLTRAIYINQYLPVSVGNVWQYKSIRTRADGTREVKTRRERAVGTDTVSGATVTVVEVTWSGTTDSMKQLVKSSSKGYGVFGEARSGDTMTYDPPIMVPNLVPVGHTIQVAFTIKHSSGAPDEAGRMRLTLTGLGPARVPAGAFADCAMFKGIMQTAGKTDQMQMVMARAVGQIRSVERNPERVLVRELEEYKVKPVRPTLMRPGTLRPAIRKPAK